MWCSRLARSARPQAVYGRSYSLIHTLCGERLLNQRIICINGLISDDTAEAVVPRLLLLESESLMKPVYLYIDSPGGVVTAGLAIYDTMQYIHSPISTLCVGQAASIGSLLLAAGTPGERRVLRNARVRTHQPSSELEILKMREMLNGIYAKHCRQPIERIEQIMDRDTFMSPQEAKEFGLIDKVIEHRPRPRLRRRPISLVSKGKGEKDEGPSPWWFLRER